MNKPAMAIVTTAFLSLSSTAWCEDSSYTVNVGAEMWRGSTKIDEIRRDTDYAPSFHAAVESDIRYLPNVSVRYTSVDADYASYDKWDYAFYYTLLHHELMNFDAGVTLTRYSNTDYQALDTRTYDFDETTFNWYASAALSIPDTNFDVIGQFDVGNSSGIKSSDVTAGIQYRLPIQEGLWTIKGGYRVIDLEFEDLAKQSPDTETSYVFVDGWFLGAEFRF
ncbi:TIGR04219 family outer membrane beta-barrel protein [Vibrio fluvialis]|nr:TIGR04219 family outer membrane beta-barrel protein [Vibrio fluvialis]